MEVQPNVTLFNYFRISALMWALLIFDVYYVCYAVALSYVRGPSIQILFGFEVSYRSWLGFFLCSFTHPWIPSIFYCSGR